MTASHDEAVRTVGSRHCATSTSVPPTEGSAATRGDEAKASGSTSIRFHGRWIALIGDHRSSTRRRAGGHRNRGVDVARRARCAFAESCCRSGRAVGLDKSATRFHHRLTSIETSERPRRPEKQPTSAMPSAPVPCDERLTRPSSAASRPGSIAPVRSCNVPQARSITHENLGFQLRESLTVTLNGRRIVASVATRHRNRLLQSAYATSIACLRPAASAPAIAPRSGDELSPRGSAGRGGVHDVCVVETQ